MLRTCPVPVPLCTSLARVPVPVPLGLARGRAELPGRGVPGEGRAGQRCAWLIRQPLKQVSLRPICLAERKEPPGAVPASQGTIPGLYTPLQGISSPRLKHKQTNSKKCLAPSFLAATGRIQPAVPQGIRPPLPLCSLPFAAASQEDAGHQGLTLQTPPHFGTVPAAGEPCLTSVLTETVSPRPSPAGRRGALMEL